jgi:hypothetical protein
LRAIAALKEAQGVFALLVTLIIGFDVWLKPGAKYRALHQANDEYAELSQKVGTTSETDTKAVRALQMEYRQINARLRNAITPYLLRNFSSLISHASSVVLRGDGAQPCVGVGDHCGHHLLTIQYQ